VNTLRILLRAGVRELESSGIESAEFEAMCMLEDCFSLTKAQYYLAQHDMADAHAAERFQKMIARRKQGEPLQYILGKWAFFGSEFFVGGGVLIPRPETETLVELAVADIRAHGRKVCFDLCAGSGCIGLSVAKLCPDVRVFLFEKFDAAFDYLRKNAEVFALSNVTLLQYDIFDGFDPQRMPPPDLILSNPPYICSGELASLQKEVQKEPKTALDGGDDGLIFYRTIDSLWAARVGSPLCVMLETGEGQPAAVAELFGEHGFFSRIEKDMFSVERFVISSK
jgi:release factor glutamine methyltransferase